MEFRRMKDIYIKNARIVLENGILWNGILKIRNGRIAAVHEGNTMEIPDNAYLLDAGGRYVGPGFVDIHVHGGNGSFLYEEPEKTGAYFLSHGETTILAALYYNLSAAEWAAAIKRVKKAINAPDGPGNLAGFYMEGPYMNTNYGAAREDNLWQGKIRKEDYQEILSLAGNLARIWVIAPEREGIKAFVRDIKSVNPGAVLSTGHSEATPEQIFSMKKYGMRLVTHCMNATGRQGESGGVRRCGPDEACILDDEMYAEVICDFGGIHVQPELLRLLVKVKGVKRLILITDSFVGKNAPGAMRQAEDLMFDARGRLCGSRLTMEAACRNMMRHTSCGIVDIFRMASLNPAAVLGMDQEIGSIVVGKRADLVIVEKDLTIRHVLKNGIQII